jgi:hypothetical protein
MQILQQIIGSMNKEEIRHLKLYMGRTNVGESRKDVDLFDYIRQHHEKYDETFIQRKLYSSRDKNALYRLKNRLLEDLGRSIALQYLDDSEFGQVVHLLTLARHFSERNQSPVALHYLQRAERKAQVIGSPDLLDLVYNEFIHFSQETPQQNPAEYIRKRRNNRAQLHQMHEIDDILAEVVFKVRTTQNFTKQDYRLIETLHKKAIAFSRSKAGRTSIQLRFKIYQLLSRIFLQKEDYILLEKYLQQTHEEFIAEKLFNRNNHDTKLQQLTYLANAQFKNKKYTESLQTAEHLKKAMDEYGGLSHDKYLFFYYNILVINYSVRDRNKAIAILNEAKESQVIRKLPFYMVFIHYNMAILYFSNTDYKKSIRHLTQLKMESSYSSLNEALRLKIEVAELIIRYELGDFGLLERRIHQVRKDFSVLLRGRDEKLQNGLIDVIEKMMKTTGSIKKDKPLMRKINALLSIPKDSSGDAVIDHDWWLRTKTGEKMQ